MKLAAQSSQSKVTYVHHWGTEAGVRLCTQLTCVETKTPAWFMAFFSFGRRHECERAHEMYESSPTYCALV